MPANNEINIRRAQPADADAMLELIKELAVYEHEPEAVTVTKQTFVETGFGENPVWWAFVAEADKKIVGIALYYIRYSTWKGPKLYLEDIVITQDWRGKGIGRMFFDILRKEAQDRNLNGMNWQVLDWNEDAINFYKKIGKTQFDGEWINCSLDI